MRNTSLLCAAEIAREIKSIPEYCELHGAEILFDPELSAKKGAVCVDGVIIVSSHLEGGDLRRVLAHELVHRLASAERWECLNRLTRPEWDRELFIELVARETERLVSSDA